MASEYLKPMLDVGSPRVLNCNVITKKILAQSPTAQTFFKCKPLNNMVLIKDSDPQSRTSSIGTKLYLPFNENDIYEGGRTLFVHTKGMEQALIENFGRGTLPKGLFDQDMQILKILDRLPSLDPFLLKDVFINERIEMNPAYFEVSKEMWAQIELYILQGFEPLAKAAFPDAISSDEIARKLIEKIWEGRDLDALQPLIAAFRLPVGQELAVFAAWKGIIFYGFERQRTTTAMTDMNLWLNEIKLPTSVPVAERNEVKTILEAAKTRLSEEWRAADRVLQEYQNSYDKMFKLRTGSGDFVSFLQNSSNAYGVLGNSLGKVGHALYCWESMSKRYPNRKMAWEQLRDLITLLAKIFGDDKKTANAAAW